MTRIRQFLLATLALCAVGTLQATEKTAAISAQDFVEQASAKGIAEMESARLALEKARSREVKAFAQSMLDDHQRANDELAKLAARKNLEVTEDAELINQAKAMVLQLRGEASFDKAYMNNQVLAHEQTIALFRQASQSTDADLASFANATLPTLEHHLKMAGQINAKLPEQ